MAPTSSSTYWAACRLVVTCPDADAADDDIELRCLDLALAFDDDLLIDDSWSMDDAACEAHLVFRMRVANGSDPAAAAWLRLLAAAWEADLAVAVQSLRCERQSDALARLRTWRDCPSCGPRHAVGRCLSCDDCIVRAADGLLAA